MKDNSYLTLLLIVALLFFILGAVMGESASSGVRKALREERAKIVECEKELPRNVNCVLIAVPEEK
jgi:hypothetical protein